MTARARRAGRDRRHRPRPGAARHRPQRAARGNGDRVRHRPDVCAVAHRARQRRRGGIYDPDWPSFVVPVLVIAAIAIVATWIPSRRATRIDPAVVLRTQSTVKSTAEDAVQSCDYAAPADHRASCWWRAAPASRPAPSPAVARSRSGSRSAAIPRASSPSRSRRSDRRSLSALRFHFRYAVWSARPATSRR